MLLTIHDANLQKVAFIDNDKQSTLNYYDDIWTRNLETGSSTFEFTVFKKAIKSDTVTSKTYNLLNERAFVSFRYHGKSYVFSVMTTEEDEQTIKCYCENLNLELINEYANPYKADKAMSFVEYCNAMDLLSFTHLSVGINEISDQKRTLEWEGQDTKLARLLSLATKFDAEIDFDTELNADSSIKSFKVNVYHEYDDKHQGVGRVRNDIQLTYGKNLRSIKRKIDKTGIYTLIRPTGKGKTKDKDGNEVDTVVTIAGLPAWSEKNADGVLEFYQSGEALYAPLAAQMYPSTFTSSTQGDQWIRKDMEVDSDNPSVIRSSAIANLRKNAYPALTYEVDGFLDVEIGDTVKIYDDGFTPILLIKARVSDQKISFTNPRNNKTTFANFKALENNLSSGIQSAFERLFEASKPYTIKLATDNGVIFKNQIGQSLITPTLFKGGKPVVADVTWRWALDGVVTVGMQYLVKAKDIDDTAVLTVSGYIGNKEVATTEITLTNVNDGADGRTPYLHIAYADDDKGTNFSLTDKNQQYQGYYSDYTQADCTDPTKYKWVDRWAKIEVGGSNLIVWKNMKHGYVDAGNGNLVTTNSPNIVEDWYSEKIYVNGNENLVLQSFVTVEPLLVQNRFIHYYDDSNDAYLGNSYSTDFYQPMFVTTPPNTGYVRVCTTNSQHAKFKLETGTVATGWLRADEDIQDDIDSKADQTLTQDQLNALEAKRLQMEIEMKALATLQQVSELETFINNLKQEDTDGRQKIIEVTKAIEERVKDIEPIMEYSQKLKFMDTYITQGNGGMVIGANESTTKVVVTPDRISFQSGGSEVAYISQRMLHIDNGVFTMSLQLGHYITRAHPKNEYVNATYFVK